ncbi:hypothetical protein BJ546DRAFT_260807 [Cryomyces antarcticus]
MALCTRLSPTLVMDGSIQVFPAVGKLRARTAHIASTAGTTQVRGWSYMGEFQEPEGPHTPPLAREYSIMFIERWNLLYCLKSNDHPTDVRGSRSQATSTFSDEPRFVKPHQASSSHCGTLWVMLSEPGRFLHRFDLAAPKYGSGEGILAPAIPKSSSRSFLYHLVGIAWKFLKFSKPSRYASPSTVHRHSAAGRRQLDPPDRASGIRTAPVILGPKVRRLDRDTSRLLSKKHHVENPISADAVRTDFIETLIQIYASSNPLSCVLQHLILDRKTCLHASLGACRPLSKKAPSPTSLTRGTRPQSS